MKKKTYLSIAIVSASLCSILLGAVNHKTRQTRPIQLGTSGGSTVDVVKDVCCSGTLGSLVTDASGKIYILSNTHVFAGDTDAGGNHKVSKVGDPINQPGYIDVGCQNKSQDYVAYLSNWAKIVPNGTSIVDAAIAETKKELVDASGSILEIGTISSTPIAAFVGQKVKKSGRTSGLTKGAVSSLNATIQVEYTDECGGDAYISTFKNQIIITPGSFLRGGDSGSLMVEDVATNPRPIGLLFAGSDTVAIANPIQDVLKTFNVSFVGTPASTSKNERINQVFSRVKNIQNMHADALLEIDGVVGHGVGYSATRQGRVVIHAFVTNKNHPNVGRIPSMLRGIPVEVLEVGKVKAL